MNVRIRFAVAAASAGLGLVVGLALVGQDPPPDNVALKDDGGRLRALLEAREGAEQLPESAPEASAAAPIPDAPAPSGSDLPDWPGGILPNPEMEVRAVEAPPLLAPIPEEDAHTLFASLGTGEMTYDEVLYYRRKPHLAGRRRFPGYEGGQWTLVTNDQGFREDGPLPEAPDRRVLVIGDSHTDGACENHESFANLLEKQLAERHPDLTIDVVNAGCGGYSFHNYARGLDRYVEELDVDVYVCAVYGGNDFLEVLPAMHYFERSRMPRGGRYYGERVAAFKRAVGDTFGRFFAQAVQQLGLFTQNEAEQERALGYATALTRWMAERARELGVDLVLVYVPPMWDIQLERFADDPEALREALKLFDGRPVGDADAWAGPWIEAASELGVPLIDLRADWRAADVDLYWDFDHHINLEGHRRVAEALLPVVEPLLSD